MKVTKRQLKQIIREEKARLLEERQEPDYKVVMAIDNFKYDIQKSLNAKMSLENRIWYKNPENIKAIFEMLDEVKAHFAEFENM